MHLSYTPQCTIQSRNVHISVLNGALWDMRQVHCGICEIGPYLHYLWWYQQCCHVISFVIIIIRFQRLFNVEWWPSFGSVLSLFVLRLGYIRITRYVPWLLMPWLLGSPGGRFKNTFELLNIRALKFSVVNKIHIFQCMGKIFCVEFQRVPLKFHTKYLTHTLKDMIFIQHWNFKSS